MRRAITRAGGLLSPSDLAAVCGERARRWPQKKGFPAPAWKSGQSYLYLGDEVSEWARQSGYEAAVRDLWNYKKRAIGLNRWP